MNSLARLCFGKNAFLRHRLQGALHGCATVLDVGCGSRSPVGGTVGMDRFESGLAEARSSGTHRHLVCGRAPGLPFRDGAFDAVVALDLIEHLERAEGERLLHEMERVARRRAILFTPNGFLPQEALGGNPWQVHRSGWSVADFTARGYSVVGVNGMRGLRGEGAEIRWGPRAAWRAVSGVTQGLLYRFPSLCFQLLCVRAS